MGGTADSITGKIGNLGAAMHTMGLVGLGVFTAVVGFFALAEKAAITYQTALTNLQNTAALTDAQTSALGVTLENLAIGTTASATQMAGAIAPVAGEIQQLTGHVLSAADATSILTAAQDVAVVKGVSLTATTKNIVDILRSYKLATSDSADVANTLVEGSDLLGISTTQLAQSFTRLQPRIVGSNMSLQDVMSTVVALGPAAGTGARAIMQVGTVIHALVEPSKAASAAMTAAGVSLYDSKGNYIGATAAIQALSVAYNKMGTEAQKTAFLQAVFGAQGKLAEQLIAGGQAGLDKATASLLANGTAAEKAALKMQDAQEQMDMLPKTINDIALPIGMVLLPSLNRLLLGMTPILQGIATWTTQNPQLATAILAVVAAVGLLFGLTVILGPVLGLIGAIVGSAVAPFVAIGVAIGLLIRYLMQIPTVAAPVKAIFQDLRNLFMGEFTDVQNLFGNISKALSGGITGGLGTVFKETGEEMRENLMLELAPLGPAFAQLGAALMKLLPPQVQTALQRVQYWLVQWDTSLKRLYASITPLVTMMTVGLKGAIDKVGGSFGNTSGNMNAFVVVINYVGDTINNLLGWLTDLLTLLGGTSEKSEAARRALMAVAGVLSALWIANKGIQFFQGLTTAVKGVITTAQDFMTPVAKLADAIRAIPGIPGAISDGFDTVRLKAMYAQDAIGNFVSKLTSIPSNVFNDLKQAIQDVGDKLKSIPSGMLDTIKDKLDTLKIKAWDARDAIGQIGDKIKGIVSSNLDTIKGKLDDIKTKISGISGSVSLSISAKTPTSDDLSKIGTQIAGSIASAIAATMTYAFISAGVAGSIVSAIGDAAAAAGILLTSVDPMTWVVVAIVALLVADFADPKQVAYIAGALAGLMFDAIVEVPPLLLVALGALAYRIVEKLGEALQTAAKNAGPTLQKIGGLITGAIGTGITDLSAVAGWFVNLPNTIANALKGISLTGIGEALGGAIGQGVLDIPTVINWFVNLPSTIATAIKGISLTGVGETIGAAIGTGVADLPAVVGWFANLPKTIGAALKGISLTPVGEALGGAIGQGVFDLASIVGWFVNLPSTIATAIHSLNFGPIGTAIGNWFSSNVSGAGTGFFATAGPIMTAIQGFITNVLVPALGSAGQFGIQLAKAFLKVGQDIAGDIIQGLANLPGEISKAVQDAFASINIQVGPFHISGKTGVSVDLPKLPFSQGAWNLPNDVNALLHKGEMVVPAQMAENLRAVLSGMGMMGGAPAVPVPTGAPSWLPPSGSGGSYGDTHIHTHLYLDGKQIAQTVDVHQGMRYLLAGTSRRRATGN